MCVCWCPFSLRVFFIFFDYALELIQIIRTHIHGHATRPEKLSSIFHTHTHYTTLLIKVNVWETRRSISRATRSIQGGCGATADHPKRPGHHQNTTTTTTSSFVFVVVVWREKARQKKIYFRYGGNIKLDPQQAMPVCLCCVVLVGLWTWKKEPLLPRARLLRDFDTVTDTNTKVGLKSAAWWMRGIWINEFTA